MNPIVKRAWDHLKTRYAVETVLLYGSFAGGTPTDRSDVDVVAWAPVDQPCHDSSVIGGRVLDAWIYPLVPGPSPASLVHVLPFQTLQDGLGYTTGLVAAIEAERAALVLGFTTGDLIQLDRWVSKMLSRAEADTLDGNYRYHWLVHDFPELWCRYSSTYYDGPVKTLKRMADEAPQLLVLYEGLLVVAKDLPRQKALWEALRRAHPVSSEL